MSQEIAHRGDIIPPSDVPFSKLTVQQRDLVLTEIAKTLHYRALVSKAVKDRGAQHMDALASKIDQEHEALAADYSDKAGEVVLRAVQLLDNFERRMMS
ncbi:hypothetical protein J2857_006158 [Neorhizobium galegae]|uniref:hypothetical protein n=1 Tax=Neorhizobium galegae TaxID=399 RepID=UPI001AE4473A|nr:hypothetical protein [Neorhizobium galegae]MBP2563359.1 hypothetical protein [Neorhizobium galegae]